MTSENTIGSKFSAHSIYNPKNPSSFKAIELLYQKLQQAPACQYEHLSTNHVCSYEETTPHVTGYNAVIPKKLAQDLGLDLYNFVRDPHTGYEQTCIAALLPTEYHLPETYQINLVAGVYIGDMAGVYTIFPGTNTPMFPSVKQNEEQMAYSFDFWENHVFLADAQELFLAMRHEMVMTMSLGMSDEMYEQEERHIIAHVEKQLALSFTSLWSMSKEVRVRRLMEKRKFLYDTRMSLGQSDDEGKMLVERMKELNAIRKPLPLTSTKPLGSNHSPLIP